MTSRATTRTQALLHLYPKTRQKVIVGRVSGFDGYERKSPGRAPSPLLPNQI